uniref:Basic helix-loop-helix (BHLH) family protein n=1 Tax=Arundo donax TaxID=35708 RepID=A0A0A9DGF2_ARUDO
MSVQGLMHQITMITPWYHLMLQTKLERETTKRVVWSLVKLGDPGPRLFMNLPCTQKNTRIRILSWRHLTNLLF